MSLLIKVILFPVFCPVVFYLKGYFAGKVEAVNILEKTQCHVHASTDTGGSVKLPVFDPTGLSDPSDVFALGDNPIKGFFVGCGFFAVQQSGFGKQCTSGANREDKLV